MVDAVPGVGRIGEEFVAAFDVEEAGLVVRPHDEALLELGPRLDELALREEEEGLVVRTHDLLLLLPHLVLVPVHHLIDPARLRLALHLFIINIVNEITSGFRWRRRKRYRDVIDEADGELLGAEAHLLLGVFGDEDAGTVLLAEGLGARGQIDRIA